MGDAIKTMICCFCSLFCRCLRANWNQYIQDANLSNLDSRHEIWQARDFGIVDGSKDFTKIFGHRDFHFWPAVSTGDWGYIVPARVMMPTVLSGLD